MLWMLILSVSLVTLLNLAYFAKDIRHPANLHLISWTVMLILSAPPLVYCVRVSLEVYAFILLNILVFNFTSLFSGDISIRSPKFIERSYFISNKFLIFLGFVGLMAALYYYQTKFGLFNLLQNPSLVRSQDKGGSGALGFLIFIPSIVFTLLIVQSSFRRKFNASTVIFLIIITLYMLILPERTTLINTFVWSAMSIFAFNVKLQRISFRLARKLLPVLLVLSSIFLAFFVIVSQRTGKSKYLDVIDYVLNKKHTTPKVYL